MTKVILITLLVIHVLFCFFVFWCFYGLTQGKMDLYQNISMFIFILFYPIVIPLLNTPIGYKIFTSIADYLDKKHNKE